MQIQNNIASVNSSRNQKIIKGKLDKSLEKLSSGFRINRAGDDAAGLAISELMRSHDQYRGRRPDGNPLHAPADEDAGRAVRQRDL